MQISPTIGYMLSFVNFKITAISLLKQLKIHQSQPKVYTLFWRFDLMIVIDEFLTVSLYQPNEFISRKPVEFFWINSKSYLPVGIGITCASFYYISLWQLEPLQRKIFFNILKNIGPPPSWISKINIFKCRSGSESAYASRCQISLQSLE